MADGKTRVRFLRAKKYPHPSGERRAVGTVLPLDAPLARKWVERGIVEPVEGQQQPSGAALSASLVDTALADLLDALQRVSDRQTIELAAASDARKGAAPLYEARLAELGN